MAKRVRLPARRERLQVDSSLAIVNIVLLLIFFFLTTGSISTSQKIPVSLPRTSELPIDLLPKPLLLISAEGDMQLDERVVAPGDLAEALADQPSLYVLADREGNAGALLDILADENLIAVQIRLVTVHHNSVEAAE